jgi:nucleotide-binding universal stress UspA family protein
MTGTDKPAKIVGGVHGSRSSLAALAWAYRQARLVDGELHAVISGWTIPINQGREPVAVGINDPDTARRVLSQAIAAVDPADPERIRRHVVQGHPARVLLDAAADADLLVVGSGSDGSAGRSLSSLCQDLVTHAPCTVVLVRSQAESDRSDEQSAAEPAVAAAAATAETGDGHSPSQAPAEV